MKAKETPAAKLTSAAAVLTALRQRYEAPAWALFENVANGTGSHADRWADALAMSVWPSRGLVIAGFEIKVSRTDLLRELKNPRKADAVGSYCDFWWIAVGSSEIAKPEDMPPSWGLLAPVATKGGVTLKVLKEAVKLTPKPLDRSFVAAILRRAHERYDMDQLRRDVREEIHAELYTNLSASLEAQYERQLQNLREQAEQASFDANTARSQLRESLGMGFDSDTLQRAVALLGKLNSWYGGEPALARALADLDQHAETMTTVRQSIGETLELVQILSGKTSADLPTG